MPDDTRLPAPSAMQPAPPSVPRHDLPRTPAAFLLRYISRFRGQVFLTMVLFGGVSAIDGFQTYVLGQLVNVLAHVAPGDPLLWFGALMATWFGSNLVSNAYGAVLYNVQIATRVAIHEELFTYLLDHAPRYFMDQTSGTLAHKIRTAAQAGMTVVDYASGHAARFIVLFGIAGVMIHRTAPDMVLPAAIYLVVVCVVAGFLAQNLRVLARAGSAAASEQAGRMGDAAANWDLIRSFAASFYERRSLDPFNAREADTFLRVRVAALVMRLILHVLSFSLLGWLAWNAFQLARAGTISVGTFTMIVSLYMMVGAYTRSFGDTLFAYFENLGQMTDAITTILAPHEIVDPPGAGTLRITGGAIEVRDVDFAYADGTWVFRHFNLRIAAGEKIGLVGASGAGKSSLIKLIRRQFPLSRGQVLIDGQDISTLTWNSVHDAFGEVPQNPGMFHRSVRENIAYGRPDATDAEIAAAAQAAHCHDFIVSRPAGYESIVGEKGMKLSGGEKQRVAIARAFLKNAPILLLDEATSSLDSEAEHLIQDALLTLMQGRTVIAIAHRLSTIMHLDRIIVLADGRVAEEGTHTTLLAMNGAYARLWQHQIGGFM